MNDIDRSEQIAFLVGSMRGVIAQMAAELANPVKQDDSDFNSTIRTIDEIIDSLYYAKIRELNDE